MHIWTKPHLVNADHVSILASIIELNKYITLAVDVMYVCGLPILITLSYKIRLSQFNVFLIEKLPNWFMH